MGCDNSTEATAADRRHSTASRAAGGTTAGTGGRLLRPPTFRLDAAQDEKERENPFDARDRDRDGVGSEGTLSFSDTRNALHVPFARDSNTVESGSLEDRSPLPQSPTTNGGGDGSGGRKRPSVPSGRVPHSHHSRNPNTMNTSGGSAGGGSSGGSVKHNCDGGGMEVVQFYNAGVNSDGTISFGSPATRNSLQGYHMYGSEGGAEVESISLPSSGGSNSNSTLGLGSDPAIPMFPIPTWLSQHHTHVVDMTPNPSSHRAFNGHSMLSSSGSTNTEPPMFNGIPMGQGSLSSHSLIRYDLPSSMDGSPRSLLNAGGSVSSTSPSNTGGNRSLNNAAILQRLEGQPQPYGASSLHPSPNLKVKAPDGGSKGSAPVMAEGEDAKPPGAPGATVRPQRDREGTTAPPPMMATFLSSPVRESPPSFFAPPSA